MNVSKRKTNAIVVCVAVIVAVLCYASIVINSPIVHGDDLPPCEPGNTELCQQRLDILQSMRSGNLAEYTKEQDNITYLANITRAVMGKPSFQ